MNNINCLNCKHIHPFDIINDNFGMPKEILIGPYCAPNCTCRRVILNNLQYLEYKYEQTSN